MTPKILFTDIDGTLLNKNRELSEKTIFQIRRIVTELSIPVILVSARMPKSMRLLQEQLGLSNEIIAYNGALVLANNDSIILEDIRILENDVMLITERALSLNLHCSLFSSNEWLISRHDEWSERETSNTKIIPEKFNDSKKEELIRKGVHKIMLMGDKEIIDKIEVLISEILNHSVSCYRSKTTYLEINTIKANKLTGMQKVLYRYNISPNEAMAIGDNYNDLEMIKSAGFGVAVNNAPELIKKHASFIAPSNIDDGVAFTIEKFFTL